MNELNKSTEPIKSIHLPDNPETQQHPLSHPTSDEKVQKQSKEIFSSTATIFSIQQLKTFFNGAISLSHTLREKFKNFVKESLFNSLKVNENPQVDLSVKIGSHRVTDISKKYFTLPVQSFDNAPMVKFEQSGLSDTVLSPEKLSTPASVFTDEFKDGDKVILSEKATRAETVAIWLNGQEALLKTLDPGEEYEKAKKALDSYRKSLKNVTWGSTNSTRFAFNELGREEIKRSLLPILGNLRIQTVTNNEEKVVSSVTRSMAITDFSHGEVSLQELQDYLILLENPLFEEGKLYGIHDMATASDMVNQIKINALIGYGTELIDESGIEKTALDVFEKIKLGKRLTQNDYKILSSLEINKEKLQLVIKKRNQHLETQVLQDLYLHLKSNPVQDTEMFYGRISLVDMQKAIQNKNGLILNEKTQGLDMKALFNRLDGRRILFDVEAEGGPYIDKSGNIHMPKDCSRKDLHETQLSTLFFNISVQGEIKNEGYQKIINDEALDKLTNIAAKHGKLIGNILNLRQGLNSLGDSKQDPFEVALLASKCFSSINGYLGVNCYGGKDRTGYAVARITHSYLPDNDANKLREWGYQLLSKKGIAANVAKENADHKILKITRFNLKLFSTSKLKGLILRILVFAEFVIVNITQMGPLKGSNAPAQLYKKM